MKFRVLILPRAEAEIEASARWWAVHHSVEQAEQWIEVIRAQLQTLVQFPESSSVLVQRNVWKRVLDLA